MHRGDEYKDWSSGISWQIDPKLESFLRLQLPEPAEHGFGDGVCFLPAKSLSDICKRQAIECGRDIGELESHVLGALGECLLHKERLHLFIRIDVLGADILHLAVESASGDRHDGGAELKDAGGQPADRAHQLPQHGLHHHRFLPQKLMKRRRLQRGDEATRARFDACRSWTAVDGGKLAEHVARAQIVEAYDLAGKRIDDDACLPGHEEKYIVGAIEILDDRLLRLIPAPRAAFLYTPKSVR